MFCLYREPSDNFVFKLYAVDVATLNTGLYESYEDDNELTKEEEDDFFENLL